MFYVLDIFYGIRLVFKLVFSVGRNGYYLLDR